MRLQSPQNQVPGMLRHVGAALLGRNRYKTSFSCESDGIQKIIHVQAILASNAFENESVVSIVLGYGGFTKLRGTSRHNRLSVTGIRLITR